MLQTLSFTIPSGENVSAVLQRPGNAIALVVLGHGSGSNMHVPLMQGISAALSKLHVATLRFEYPYSDQPGFLPYTDVPMDPDEVLTATIRAALGLAIQQTDGIPVFVAGHSVSALMATLADAESGLPAKAVVALAFPRKGDASRAAHLVSATLPKLFIQGTLDPLGTVAEISDMVEQLGEGSSIRWIENATHGFQVDGRDFQSVIDEICLHIRDYISAV